jgi:hypothetical protein
MINGCKLDYEDSIHLAVVIRTGAQEMVIKDEDFDIALVKRVI